MNWPEDTAQLNIQQFFVQKLVFKGILQHQLYANIQSKFYEYQKTLSPLDPKHILNMWCALL